MAYSEVEIASSPSFGCVLGDHNRRDRITKFRTAFQKNVCISNSTPDANSLTADEWVRNSTTRKNVEILSPNSQRHARVLERWTKAREMVISIDRPSEEEREKSLIQLDTSVELPNLGGVSSLVQRWKDFTEKRMNQNPKINNPNTSLSSSSSSVFSSKCNSENASFVELPVPPAVHPNYQNQDGNPNSLGLSMQSNRPETYDGSVDERFDTPSMMTDDSFMDWESDRTALSGSPSVQGRRDTTDRGESERLRVADMIRKLTSENQMQDSLMFWKNEQGASASSSPHRYEPSLPRLQMIVSDQQAEQRGCFLSPVVSSPRLRGRQAFNDLLMQLERDRHRELDGLVERRAVSRFSHRGRIQSLLRLRFLRRETETRNDHHSRQNSRQQTQIRVLPQQHSHSAVLKAQQHSHCEAAAEAPQLSQAIAVLPQQLSCHEGDTSDEPNFCHAGVSGQQYSNSEKLGALRHSCWEATVGNEQHTYSKEVRVLETAQGEARIADRQQAHSRSLESSGHRQASGSSVLLLREKFDVPSENDSSTSRPPLGVDRKISSSSNQFMEEPPNQNLVSYAVEDDQKEGSPRSDHQGRGIRHDLCNIDSQECAALRLTTSNIWEENMNAEEQDSNNPGQTTKEDTINRQWEEQDASNQLLVETDQDWISNVSRPWSQWDEQEVNSHQMIGANNDWITDIARPRSDWEGLREARYQEMLDPHLDNEDIRQLLERRSVSTFLSSNLRDTMDQMIISRVERLPQSMGNEQEEEDGMRDRLDLLMLSHMPKQTHAMTSRQQNEEQQEDVEEDQKEEEEEEEEEDSPVTCQCSEVGDYMDQVEGCGRTWSRDDNYEVSDDSDQVESQSSQQPQSSQVSYSDTRRSPFITNSSIDMELIYDLRVHMVQLRQEMCELKKSIKSCVNMQEKLQRSIKLEVADAVSHSVRRMEESLNRGSRKRSCCVCYEMQVDSLLYRCGHMCTCFNCANELQWSSGKCPICRAPIVDVVRAYANDS